MIGGIITLKAHLMMIKRFTQASLKMRLTDKTKIITNLEEEIQSLKDQITSLENDKAKNEQKKITATRSKKNTHDNVDDRDPSTGNSDKKEIEEKFEKKEESKVHREKKTAKSEKEREIERINAKIAEEEKKKVRITIQDRIVYFLFVVYPIWLGKFYVLQVLSTCPNS